MRLFRNSKNGQFCTAGEYEKQAVAVAVKEWEEPERFESQQVAIIPPALLGGLIVTGALALIIFLVVGTLYLLVRL
jgi:preprotein translocase subunit SecF